jgi:competence protein ComEC
VNREAPDGDVGGFFLVISMRGGSWDGEVVRRIALVALLLVACREAPRPETATPPVAASATTTAASAPPSACRPGPAMAMTVRFFDVGQGLSALVELPGGRLVLVDTGDDPARSEEQCHGACRGWHAHLMSKLHEAVGSRTIDLLWITHQHSDHLGGAADVLANYKVATLVDNGQEPNKKEVRGMHEAAARAGARYVTVDPEHHEVPLVVGGGVRLAAVVPSAWPTDCAHSPNDCSIGLRIDDCRSSVLFVGDAEKIEEARLDPGGQATLLQVGHHGSETSSSAGFLDRVRPSYAVISCAKKDEGTNETYCHPREDVVERLDAVLGGQTSGSVAAFDGKRRCKKAGADDWKTTSTRARLFVTARDGDVTLRTDGDATFTRVTE